MRKGFTVVAKGQGWRLLRTGNTLLAAFSGRFAALFGILNLGEYTHWSDIHTAQHDCDCLTSGMYGRLMLARTRDAVEGVPSSTHRF